jgi:2-polyprenyl-6-methoxyphenol hydroxylase-like FAD-dependent oxidoreductase
VHHRAGVKTASALSILVLGGGVAGLSAALALARNGHAVSVVERDDVALGEPLESLSWDRAGIPHFMQPHAFTPRGRKEMQATFPDVFDALIAAGAWDLDLRPKLRGGTPRQDDAELAFLAVRRPLIEWALRRAVLAEPTVTVIPGTKALGLVSSLGRGSDPPTVRGVETTAGALEADLVIDAMGRRSPTPGWIVAAGGRPMDERSNDCGIIYYCRYYRVLDGATLPDVPSVPGPRGDLGYAAFSTFPGDNRTFAALVAIPPGNPDLKILRNAGAFEAATRLMPALDSWTNADTAAPITDVLPMGSLQNTLRSLPDGRPATSGLISVGDVLCHTDPVLSLGLSIALIHARLLADAVREQAPDVTAAALAFDALARPEMEERFAYVSAIDDTRTRLWAGETIDYTHADGGAYEFFTYAAAGVAALAGGDLARALARRNSFLDPLAVLDEDPGMLRELERFHGRLATMSRRQHRVPREELIGAMTAAAG